MFNKDVVILRVGEKIPMLSGFNGCVMEWLSGTAAYCIVLGAPAVSLQNEVIGSLEKKIRFAKYTSGNVMDSHEQNAGNAVIATVSGHG